MIGTFTKGQHVSVYPHGDPRKAAEAVVILISANQKSIAVQFDDAPPFAVVRGGGYPLAPDFESPQPEKALRITMLAYREDQGPWVELMGGGHYEIEGLD